MGRFGSLDLSPIWRVELGTRVQPDGRRWRFRPRSSRAIPDIQPTTSTPRCARRCIFGDRGAYLFKGYGVVDLAATYAIPVWKSASPWFKVEIYNVLNNQKQIAWDKTVSVTAANRAGALDANGIPLMYTQGPRFGTATNDNQFPQPFAGQNGGRAMRVAFGARF